MLAGLKVIGRHGGELVLSTGAHSVFVDVSAWPARVVNRNFAVRFAARQVEGGDLDGSWRVYASTDPDLKTWTVKVFPALLDDEQSEDPDPLPVRDFSALLEALDEAAKDRERESWHRIESLALCGPFPVVVPRYCGLGQQRLPWVQRNGVWSEDASLPPLDKPLAEADSAHPAHAAVLDTGPGILLWQGRFYLMAAAGFVDYCAAELPIDTQQPPIPAKGGGMFALRGTQLVEVHIDTVREHLVGVTVHRVLAGPDDMLIVETAEGPLLYDVAKSELAELASVVGDFEIATAVNGDLVTFDHVHALLYRITREELAALPRRPAELVVEPPAAPVRILDALGAATRPVTACIGDLIIQCADDGVRYWNLDLPATMMPLPAIALAVRGDQVAALDAKGVLHELDASGALLISRSIAERPRSLAPAPDHWLVIAEEAVFAVGETTVARIEVAGAFAAAADPDGTVVILAEDRRLARWEAGQVFDIPESVEQLVAIAPLGGRRFICAGERNLFVLDLAQLELEALYEQNETPFLAASPNGKTIAWATHHSVAIASLDGTTLAVIEESRFPDTFIEPAGEPLRVRGLAFLDDQRVAVAIPSGYGGEMFDFVARTTRKLDPHPGDTRNRYLLTYAGVVLLAEDP